MNRISWHFSNAVARTYRRKHFLRAAALRAWPRSGSVGLILVLWFATPPRTGNDAISRVGGFAIACGYLWMDAHFGAKELERRFSLAETRRRYRAMLKRGTP